MTGEGEGSKATLIAWLKRRAAQQYGQRVVGQHVWVCWCADATFYKGLITHYSPETGKHKVTPRGPLPAGNMVTVLVADHSCAACPPRKSTWLKDQTPRLSMLHVPVHHPGLQACGGPLG